MLTWASLTAAVTGVMVVAVPLVCYGVHLLFNIAGV